MKLLRSVHSVKTCFFIACVLLSERALAQSHPDFSGTWQQANARCDPQPKNKAYSYRAVIHQQGTALNVDISVSGARENGDLHLHYEIGGEELVYTGLDHDEFHTRVHWEGDRLVFKTVEHERGRLIEESEVWTLFDGGNSLKRVRQENEPGEHATRTYVLEKG